MNVLSKEMLSDEQFNHLLRFFQVFSNESRLKLIGYLADGEKSVGELAELVELKEPTVSHHLSEMKSIGLVNVRAEGTMRFYQLNSRALEAMSKDIFARPNLAALVRPKEMSHDERVLRTWIKDGRITGFPAQEQKIRVLIHWLAQRIDPAQSWTEREFNEWLAQYNDDYAFMRRYLVTLGYMSREDGLYRRLPASNPAA